MGLFSKITEKKKESTCCGNCAPEVAAKLDGADAAARVKVLGGGCKKCNELEAATVEALAALKMDTSIDHVTDYAQIAAYGVMTTPALVVDGKVLSCGKVLKKDEIIKLLQNIQG